MPLPLPLPTPLPSPLASPLEAPLRPNGPLIAEDATGAPGVHATKGPGPG